VPKGVYERTAKMKTNIGKARVGIKLSKKHRENIGKGLKNRWKTDLKGSRDKEKNPNYKGGRCKDGWGYVQVKLPEHPNADCRGYVKEHRLVYGDFLGRPLTEKEIVHHIDFVKTNNDINNLYLCSRKHNSLMNFELKRLMGRLLRKKLVYFEEETGHYYLTGDEQRLH